MPTHQLVALGDVCIQDRTIAKAADQRPVLGLDQINSDDGTIHAAQGSKAAGGEGTYFVYDERHVLFSKLRPYLNKVGKPTSSGRCSTELVPLLPNTKIVREYLFYLMRSPRLLEAAIASSTGARMPRANVDVLLREKIALPPLDEQQRIVDILDRAASIQRLRQAADEKLKQIIPALFVDMFGDPATNPKGWQKSALGGLINIRSSVRLPDLVSEADELCIGADAISSGDGKLLFQPTVGSVMPKSGKYFFHEGDVLYSKIRPYLCKAWLADCAGYCSADIYAIECKEQLTPHFLKYLLLSKDFTDYAVAQSSRASMPKVNREALSAYEFPLPPVELQREFSARAERVLSLAKLSSEASGSGDLSMASLSSQFFNAA